MNEPVSFEVIDMPSLNRENSHPLWRAFYLRHPYFDSVERSPSSQAVSNQTELVDLTAQYEDLPDTIRQFINLKTEDEIETVIQKAVDEKRLNTFDVQIILRQPLAIYYIWKMYLNNKIDARALMRFTELQEQLGLEIHKIKKSIDENEIAHLRQLIDNGLVNLNHDDDDNSDPYSEIIAFFKRLKSAYVLLGLLDSPHMQGLQMQQIYTLFEFFQCYRKRIGAENVSTKGIQPVFLQDGKINEELAHIFTDEERALIKQLPASEQVVLVTTLHSSIAKLTRVIMRLNSIPKDKKYAYLPSCGIQNARGIVRYGKDFYPVRPSIGLHSLSEIEQGIREDKARIGYIYSPLTPDPGWIHESRSDTYPGILCHDVFHSKILSTFPEYIKSALLRCIDVIREKAGMTWSKETWLYIDGDFRYFSLGEFNKHDQPMAQFCSMLDTSQSDEMEPYGGIIDSNSQLTLVGIWIFLDMIKNKNAWQAIGLDPDQLPTEERNHALPSLPIGVYKPKNYRAYYQKLLHLHKRDSELLNKSPSAQVFETMLYFNYASQLSNAEQDLFFEFVSELDSQNLLSIDKIGNSLSLKFANEFLFLNSCESMLRTELIVLFQRYKQSKQSDDNFDFISEISQIDEIIEAICSIDIKMDLCHTPAIFQSILLSIQNNISRDVSDLFSDTLKSEIKDYLSETENLEPDLEDIYKAVLQANDMDKLLRSVVTFLCSLYECDEDSAEFSSDEPFSLR